MDLSQPPRPTEVVLKVTFDESSGVISVGYSTAPPVKLGSTLAYRLTADEARTLARALDAFASKHRP